MASSQDPEAGASSSKAVEARGVRHPTSYCETLMMLLKCSVGSGLFAMGEGFRNAGLVMGPIFTVLIASICTVAQHKLITTSRMVAERLDVKGTVDYAETAELAFKLGPGPLPKMATSARRVVNTFIFMTQIGICSVFFVFVATNVKQVLDQYIVAIDSHAYMAMALVPILAVTMVRNLKYMAPVSFICNIIMIAGLVMTLYACAKDGFPDLAKRDLIADWKRWPLFFGTAAYSLEFICVVMPLMNEMKNPRDFDRPLGVMNVNAAFVASVLVVVGFVGYAKFGEDVKGSLTLNLDHTSLLGQVLKVVISIGIVGTFPLQAYVPADLVWSVQQTLVPPRWHRLAELSLRLGIVAFTFLLAESVPRLGLFISLVGALSMCSLQLLFPPILDWVSLGRDMTFGRHLGNALLVCVGFFVTGWGTYSSLTELIAALGSDQQG